MLGRWHGGAGGACSPRALPLMAFGTISQHRDARTDADRTLSFEVSEQTANVADYFGRFGALTQILAKNPSFAEF